MKPGQRLRDGDKVILDQSPFCTRVARSQDMAHHNDRLGRTLRIAEMGYAEIAVGASGCSSTLRGHRRVRGALAC